MILRLPKLLHGWRAFFGEVGVVVLGVLIALGASQWVESRRERQLSRDAHANVRAEIAEALGRMASRIAQQPCVDRRIVEIAAALMAADRGEPAQPFSWIGRPSFWTLSDARWQTASNSGATFLFDPDEQAQYSFIYSGIRDFEDHERIEQAAWAQLRSLTEIRHLEAPQRAYLTQALQAARVASFRMTVNFSLRTEAARELGIAPQANPLPMPRNICLDRNTTRAAVDVQNGTKFREPD